MLQVGSPATGPAAARTWAPGVRLLHTAPWSVPAAPAASAGAAEASAPAGDAAVRAASGSHWLTGWHLAAAEKKGTSADDAAGIFGVLHVRAFLSLLEIEVEQNGETELKHAVGIERLVSFIRVQALAGCPSASYSMFFFSKYLQVAKPPTGTKYKQAAFQFCIPFTATRMPAACFGIPCAYLVLATIPAWPLLTENRARW